MIRSVILGLILFGLPFCLHGSEQDSLRSIRQELLQNRLKQESFQSELQAKDTLLLTHYYQKRENLLLTKSIFPILFNGDTLFTIYDGIGPLSAKERADRISKHIKSLADDEQFEAIKLVLEQENNLFRLVYAAETTVFVLSENDALYSLQTLKELAESYRSTIVVAVERSQSETAWLQLLYKGLLVLLVIGVFSAIIIGINKAYRAIQQNAYNLQSKILTRLRIGNYQLFDEKRASLAMAWLLKASRIFLILLSFYLLLPVVFSIFPFTEGLAQLLFGYIWSPFKAIVLSILAFIPNLFTIAVIFFVTRAVVRFLRFLAHEIEKEELVIPGFFNEWAVPTYNIVRFLLYAFMIVVIFPYLPGSDSKVFQGVSVFLGILFSLGSSSAISNMVAGLVITYMRPFRVGDVIQLGEHKGEVVEKNLLITRIRTPKNEEITIPNAAVLAGQSVNFSVAARAEGLALYTTITIGYDVPWQKVHEMLLEAAKRTDGILDSRAPFVLQTSLDDFYVSYQLNVFTQKPIEMPAIYSALHAHIQDVFNENGIEIMSPHYRAARDGNTTTVPASYLPADYSPPAFRVDHPKKQ